MSLEVPALQADSLPLSHVGSPKEYLNDSFVSKTLQAKKSIQQLLNQNPLNQINPGDYVAMTGPEKGLPLPDFVGPKLFR